MMTARGCLDIAIGSIQARKPRTVIDGTGAVSFDAGATSLTCQSTCQNTRRMRGVAGTSLPTVVAALSLAVTQALANPHVWVETRITFELEDHRVDGFRFEWRFDDYYSSHVIRSHDLDGDGTLGPQEMRTLRTDSFDPLARFDYYVHVWAGSGRREGHEVDRFSARVEDERLVYEFSMPVTPPADPDDGPVVVSLFDRENAVDFQFAESNFLLADGVVKANCRFRIAPGRGEQSGHPRPVTLGCAG